MCARQRENNVTVLGFNRKDFDFMLSLARINIGDRYLGSALGAAWAVLNPLLMFSIFVFVFGFIFKARIPGSESTLSYSIWMICGYGPWLATSEALTSASYSIVTNSGLVKNMSFKTEILPISSTIIGFIPLGVGLIVAIVLILINHENFGFSIIWLPLIVFIQFLFLSSIGLGLALITTFIRDFGILLPNILTVVLYATPIFYPIEALPAYAQFIMKLNPFYIISSSYRTILMNNKLPDVFMLIILGIFSIFLLSTTLVIFRRIKGILPMIV